MRRMPAPARARMAWAASPACADASRAGAGPGRASPGRNITPGHHPSPQGLRPDGPRTAGVEETYMARRGFDTESYDPPGSAVGKDSDEALHRKSCRFAGNSNPSNGSIERGATLFAYHVLLQFHAFAYLCPVSVSWDLAALISQRPPIAAQDWHQLVKGASSVRGINQR